MATFKHSARKFRLFVLAALALIVVAVVVAIILAPAPDERVIAPTTSWFLFFVLFVISSVGAGAYNLGRMANFKRIEFDLGGQPLNAQTRATLIDRVLPVWLVGVVASTVLALTGAALLALSGNYIMLVITGLALVALVFHLPSEQTFEREVGLVRDDHKTATADAAET
jgi:hypothetical protein